VRGRLARFYLFRGLGLTWIYVPFQWFYLRAHGLRATELMMLNTVFCVAAVLLEVPTGALADWVGRKAVLVAGAVASSLSCLAFVAFPSAFAGLAAANVLAALAMTCISGADSAYLFDLVGGRARPDVYQRLEASSSAVRLGAAALGGLTAWAIVVRGGGLSSLYLVTAALTAAAALVGLTLPRTSSRPRSSTATSGRHRVVAALAEGAVELVHHARRGAGVVVRRRDLLVLLGLSAVLFPVLRVGLFLDQPFLQSLGFATAAVGLAFAAKDLVAALAAAAVARLLPRVGERRLFLSLPIITGLALLAMGFASGPVAALLVLVPTAAFGVYSPLVRVFVNRRLLVGRDRATVLSIEGMARRLGFALFSPLVGAVFDVWSLGAALVVSSAWAGCGLAVAGIFALRGRRGGGGRGRDRHLEGPSEAVPVPVDGLVVGPAPTASAMLCMDPGIRCGTLLSSNEGAAAAVPPSDEDPTVEAEQAA